MIDVRTSRPILFVCPSCKQPSRGLMNAKCSQCNDEAGFYENMAGKPSGSFRGVYEGTPIFEVAELK